jgi:hypothetical protein
MEFAEKRLDITWDRFELSLTKEEDFIGIPVNQPWDGYSSVSMDIDGKQGGTNVNHSLRSVSQVSAFHDPQSDLN